MVTYGEFSAVTGLADYDALDDRYGWPEHK
jgi:hypothetical protein